MHFPIIELKDQPIPSDERMSPRELYDDSCVNYFTDYVGDEYTLAERKEFLKGWDLPNLLEGIAIIDVANESLIFLDAEKIQAARNLHVKIELKRLLQKFDKGVRVTPNDIAYAGEYWRNFDELFHYDGCVHTAGDLISDAVWFAGKTLYIGAIIDAHC